MPYKRTKIGVILKWHINALARHFYEMHGYEVPKGYDFSTAKHPQERLMWVMAFNSFFYWEEMSETKRTKKK